MSLRGIKVRQRTLILPRSVFCSDCLDKRGYVRREWRFVLVLFLCSTAVLNVSRMVFYFFKKEHFRLVIVWGMASWLCAHQRTLFKTFPYCKINFSSVQIWRDSNAGIKYVSWLYHINVCRLSATKCLSSINFLASDRLCRFLPYCVLHNRNTY